MDKSIKLESFIFFRDEFKNERPNTDVVYYRSPSSANQEANYYMGRINEQESLATWSKEKCVPLVREITFANAEELTDEGLPFLILFHTAKDQQSISLFEREVAKQLQDERSEYFLDYLSIHSRVFPFSKYQLFTCRWCSIPSSITTFRKIDI